MTFALPSTRKLETNKAHLSSVLRQGSAHFGPNAERSNSTFLEALMMKVIGFLLGVLITASALADKPVQHMSKERSAGMDMILNELFRASSRLNLRLTATLTPGKLGLLEEGSYVTAETRFKDTMTFAFGEEIDPSSKDPAARAFMEAGEPNLLFRSKVSVGPDRSFTIDKVEFVKCVAGPKVNVTVNGAVVQKTRCNFVPSSLTLHFKAVASVNGQQKSGTILRYRINGMTGRLAPQGMIYTFNGDVSADQEVADFFVGDALEVVDKEDVSVQEIMRWEPLEKMQLVYDGEFKILIDSQDPLPAQLLKKK
jgi:hypothetical protein